MKKALLALAVGVYALSAGNAYAGCGNGTCEPPKPPKKALVADCGNGCDVPKPPKKVLVAGCGNGTCEPPKPPKKFALA